MLGCQVCVVMVPGIKPRALYILDMRSSKRALSRPRTTYAYPVLSRETGTGLDLTDVEGQMDEQRPESWQRTPSSILAHSRGHCDVVSHLRPCRCPFPRIICGKGHPNALNELVPFVTVNLAMKMIWFMRTMSLTWWV